MKRQLSRTTTTTRRTVELWTPWGVVLQDDREKTAHREPPRRRPARWRRPALKAVAAARMPELEPLA